MSPPPFALPPAPEASSLARVGAFVGALFALLIGSFFTMGTVLIAPVGVAIAAAIRRRRGGVLSLVGRWIASLVSVGIALAIVASLVVAATPPGAWRSVQAAMDSASRVSAKKPAPSPFGAPPISARDSARIAAHLPAIMSTAAGAGITMLVVFVVLMGGTIGCAAALLLSFAIRGRWTWRDADMPVAGARA